MTDSEDAAGADEAAALPLSSQIGEWLREQRERVGWTQTDLAAASGISQANISRLESTPGPVTTEATVRKLVRALGADLDEALAAAQIGVMVGISQETLRMARRIAALPPELRDAVSAVVGSFERLERLPGGVRTGTERTEDIADIRGTRGTGG